MSIRRANLYTTIHVRHKHNKIQGEKKFRYVYKCSWKFQFRSCREQLQLHRRMRQPQQQLEYTGGFQVVELTAVWSRVFLACRTFSNTNYSEMRKLYCVHRIIKIIQSKEDPRRQTLWEARLIPLLRLARPWWTSKQWRQGKVDRIDIRTASCFIFTHIQSGEKKTQKTKQKCLLPSFLCWSATSLQCCHGERRVKRSAHDVVHVSKTFRAESLLNVHTRAAQRVLARLESPIGHVMP